MLGYKQPQKMLMDAATLYVITAGIKAVGKGWLMKGVVAKPQEPSIRCNTSKSAA